MSQASPDQPRAGRLRRNGQRLAVLASLGLVLVAGVAALIMVQGIDRQISDVLHSYEVRNQARELTIALAEAESSQRGYVLTGDALYLEPFRRSQAGIGTRMQSLQAVTAGNSQQTERVTEIAGRIDIKMTEMARTIELVGEQRTAEARALIEAGMGTRLMSEVRGILENFISEENSTLLARNADIDRTRRLLVGALIAALAGAAILAYSLFSRTRQQVHVLAANRHELLSQKEALEAEVRERTQAIEEARAHAQHERERVETLLQDTNHRIGNSLATVSSLLGLQLIRSKSAEVREALEAARSRVHAVASAHRRLRLGGDLETVSADEFLTAVVDDLRATVDSSKAVELKGDFEPVVLGGRDATTIGILVGELVTNALKHAFPTGHSGTVTVALKRGGDGIPILSVTDDGVGMAEGSAPGEGGLGSVIVKQLAHQFDGVPHYGAGPNGGVAISVPLPGLEKQPVDADPS